MIGTIGAVRLGRVVIFTLSVVGSVAPPVAAVEIGCDASVGIESVAADHSRVIHVSVPGAPGIDGGLFQTFRAAFPIGGKGAIELAPGMSIYSYSIDAPGVPRQTQTTKRFSLGVSYLRGRSAGNGAAPYVRAGLQARARDNSVGSTVYQAGSVLGGGIRWRLSNVIGLRSEISVAKWFEGDFHGQWDGQLKFGISAFTK
jgi:hypothetical protein